MHTSRVPTCSCESGLIHIKGFNQNDVKFDISENGFRNCSSLSGIVNIESTTLTAKYDIDIKKNSFIGTTDPKAVFDVHVEGVSKGTVNAKYNYWVRKIGTRYMPE